MNARFAVAALAVGGLSLLAGGCANGSGRTPEDAVAGSCGPATWLAALPPEIGEASGIARDPRRPDLFWLHNDSGNEPLLFAVDTTGALLATVRMTGGSARDLEDLSIARCGESWCLFLGDIGDNMAVRRNVKVHRLPLPDLPPTGKDAEGGAGTPYDQVLSPLATWRLEYPDGPRDAEALVVDAEHGDLIVISKGRDARVQLYSAPVAELEAAGDATVSLQSVGRLDIPIGRNTTQFVTAADLSSDGTRLAVRSYAELFLYSWPGVAQFDTATAPLSTSLLTAFEPQGEAVAWGEDGETLYLASEERAGRPPQLSRIRCPRP